jgi:hypothetical protein
MILNNFPDKTAILRMIKCSKYMLKKRSNTMIRSASFDVGLPVISGMLVDEIDTNGKSDIIQNIVTDIENFMMTYFLYKIITIIILKINSKYKENTNK